MAKIGFIGLGHMGFPMAVNLVKQGHEVQGFDLNPNVLENFSKVGGLTSANVIECATGQDVVFTMLQTGNQVKDVCLGENGFYRMVNSALLHIDCSSIDVPTAKFIHEEAAKYKIVMVDSPVSGGVRGAQNASLTFMVGGNDEAVAKASSYLQLIGKKIINTGAAGTGQAAKICNNMILGISMIAVSEAFILAEKLGLKAEKLFEVVNNSSGQCWAMTNYAPLPNLVADSPANNNYQPGFTAAMMLKDLKLSQQSAQTVNTSTQLGHQATIIYQQFVEQGFGEIDFSAIIKMLNSDN